MLTLYLHKQKLLYKIYISSPHGIGPCLHESGLTPKKFSYKEDAELVNYGIGLASLIPRTTASVEELSTSVHACMHVKVAQFKEKNGFLHTVVF